MQTRNKFRLMRLAKQNGEPFYKVCGRLRGTVKIIGDIVGPAWTDGPWDAELGIAYQGENGPVYYTGKGTETTDDI